MNGEPIKTLLIEGNPKEARRISDMLEDNNTNRVHLTHVERLDEGLQLLDEESFDVLLLDLSLPDSMGLDTLSLMQTRAPDVPIVLITDLDDHKKFAVKAILQGAQDTLVNVHLNNCSLRQSIRNAIVRKRTDDRLRHSNAIYRNIFEGVRDAILVESLSGEILDANSSACEIYGWSREELMSKTVSDLVPEGHLIVLPSGASNGDLPTTPIETVNLRANGEPFPVEITTRLQDIGNDTVMLVVVRDVSERKQTESALRESELRFSAVVRTATDAIVTIDDAGEIVFWNAAAATIFGYSEDEVLGQPISLIIPRGSRGDFTKGMARLSSTGETKIVGKVVELQGLKKDGTEFPLELSLSAWEADEKTYFTAIIRDITDSKKAQELVAIHLQRLDVLCQIDLAITSSLDLSSTLDVLLDQITRRLGLDAADVLLLDPDHQILRHAAGRGFKTEALQHTKLELGEGYAGQVADNRETLFVPDLRQEPGSLIRSHLFESEGFVAYFSVPLIAKGEVKGVLEFFHRSKLEPDEGWFSFVEMLATQAAIAIDIATMYRELEQHSAFLEQAVEEATGKLRQSKKRLETILNNSPDAILLLSVEGTIEMTNRSFLDLYGYTSSEARGKSICFLIEEQSLEDCRGVLLDVVEHLETKKTEIIAIRKGETKLEIEMGFSPIRRNGGLDGIVCTMRDISTLKQVERMKDAFVSNVSHELRTPITTMRLNYSLLRKNPGEHKYLDRFDREITRLNQMVEDLLRLSRLDQGQVELNLETVDLNDLLAETVRDRVVLAESHELELVFINPEVHIPSVQADANLLGQVLSVLLSNAIDYTPAGGHIEVRALHEERDGASWAGFQVKDDGLGISSDDLPHLFERFYRGKVGRESGAAGTGLGLSIASEIVKRHRGHIDVENAGIPGEGTTFTVWLPADNGGNREDE